MTRSLFRKFIMVLGLAAVAFAGLGCPPERKSEDHKGHDHKEGEHKEGEHKEGDGHDHGEDKKTAAPTSSSK